VTHRHTEHLSTFGLQRLQIKWPLKHW